MSGAEFLQSLVDGVAAGGALALLAVGLGLVLGVTARFHFALASSYVLPVYLATSLMDAGLPTYVAVLCGLAIGVVLGVLVEALLYRPLARRSPQAALLAVFVTSLGIVIAVQNLIVILWGSDPVSINPGFTVSFVSLGGTVGVTTLQLATVGLSIVLVGGVIAYVKRSRNGRALRAVQDNPELAVSVGVNVPRAYAFAFAIGSLFAGVAGVLASMSSGMLPDAGITPTFTAFVAVFLVGSQSSLARFAASGLVVAVLQSVCSAWLAPAWSPVVTFGVLFLYIALMPMRDTLQLRWHAARLAKLEG